MKKYSFSLLIYSLIIFNLQAQTLSPVTEAPNPKASGNAYVSNPDGILSPSEESYLNSLLSDLENTTTNEFAVVVVNSIGDEIPKDYAHMLFNNWGVGKAGKDNGLLLLVVMDQRRMEVETGYGIEPILPDALVKNVQLVEMVPYFQVGKPNLGIKNGVEAYCRIMKEPENMDIIASYRDVEEQGNYWEDVVSKFFMALHPIFTFYLVAFIVYVIVKKPAAKNINSSNANVVKPPLTSLARWRFLYFRLPLVFIAIFIFINLNIVLMLVFCIYGYAMFVASEMMVRIYRKAEKEKDNHEKCNLLRSAIENSSWKVIFFPVPLLFFRKFIERRIAKLRYQSRSCPHCKGKLLLINERDDDKYLDEGEQIEEKIKSVDYDVWRCRQCEYQKILAYENNSSRYILCDGCLKNCSYLFERETLKHPTYSSIGKGVETYKCENCNHVKELSFTIPQLKRSSSSRSSSSSSLSRSSSSSSGSWGGGSSGGGGAGSSW